MAESTSLTHRDGIVLAGGVTHDFENRSMARAGFINISVPGDFEPRMPEIAKSLHQIGPM